MVKHNSISSVTNNRYRVASMALIVSSAFGLITGALSEEATPDLPATGSQGREPARLCSRIWLSPLRAGRNRFKMCR